jgi:hypothetical protein
MQLDLTDEEHEALAAYLRVGIAAEKYPLSPRLAPIKAVLEKLAPSKPVPLPPKPSQPPEPPSCGRYAKRR